MSTLNEMRKARLHCPGFFVFAGGDVTLVSSRFFAFENLAALQTGLEAAAGPAASGALANFAPAAQRLSIARIRRRLG
ncbi:MAG TPA: hypothetical protein VIZ90_11060 [Rhizobiaceae bacterium]